MKSPFFQVTLEAISRRTPEDGETRTDLIQMMINAHKDVSDEKEVENEAAQLGATYDRNAVKRGDHLLIY